MASLILVKPGLDWAASGGLFDFTLEFLIPRLSDERAAESLRTVVDNNLGSVWLTEFPPATQQEIFELLRTGLIPEAQRALPESPAKKPALDLLQQLVDLTSAPPAK
ncbi:hypothetical protein [Actinoplanes sp. NPDC049599]|uniref:hypothetical protein n=1 Tax=Actinoplanes sp. NPDC049599 TaxID=3363903 RepID=UPI0037A3F669